MSGAAAASFVRSTPCAARSAARPLGRFRLLLALLVVLQHFQHLLPASSRATFSAAGLGAVAVCLFFAVSGFVVAEAASTVYAGRPGAFFVNRLLRIAPAYYAALALAALVQWALWRSGRLDLWDYRITVSPADPRLLVSGLASLVPGYAARPLGQPFEYIPFAWSLRCELAFYVATAAAMLAARRWRGAIPMALGLGLLASAAFLLRMRPGLLSTAPMFLVGAGLAAVLRGGGAAARAFLVAATGLAFVGFVSWQQHGSPVLVWQAMLLALLLAVFLLLATGRASRVDGALGELSYPLYLNHYVVGLAVTNLTAARGWTVYGAGVVGALLLAWAMQRVVEQPLKKIRTKVRGSASRAAEEDNLLRTPMT